MNIAFKCKYSQLDEIMITIGKIRANFPQSDSDWESARAERWMQEAGRRAATAEPSASRLVFLRVSRPTRPPGNSGTIVPDTWSCEPMVTGR